MNALRKKLLKTLYRKSLYDFVKDFWHTCDPAKYTDGLLVQFYCEAFQYMCKDWIGYEEVNITIPDLGEDVDIIDVRQNKQNLNINVPPRHTKSMIFNVFGPVWLWINSPIKAASVSHTTGLASQMNDKRTRILDSEEFKELFGDEVWLDTNSRGKLVDTRGGELYSVARNSFTGFGADIIINDDLTNAETARRDQAEMLSAWSYFQNTMPSRINNRKQYLIMNIQQRLAPNDITGHILADPKLAARYAFIVLPAIFSKKTILVFPISGKVHIFEKGDFLWPERFGDYEALRAEVGEVVFETQYLQNAIASDRTVIKDSMIITQNKVETPGFENADIQYSSHDFPVKDKETSDYLGSVLGYRLGSTLYIIDCIEKKMAFTASVNYVQQLDTLYPGIIQVIEDKANGSPILQQLQDVVAGMQAFSPGTASKYQRLESASLYLESGNVVFVKTVFDKMTQTWQLSDRLKMLIERLKNFPFVEHDDIVDAFVQLILFVFMDRRYMVYGRAFNDANIVKAENFVDTYWTTFFNREGDIWKVCKIGIHYGIETKLYVAQELQFKASIQTAFEKLKTFSKSKVFIDCSATEGLYGYASSDITIERYTVDDFEKSVADLSLAFAKKRILVNENCKLVRADIENFKYAKSKTETAKYATTRDGFCSTLRIAMTYYGDILN